MQSSGLMPPYNPAAEVVQDVYDINGSILDSFKFLLYRLWIVILASETVHLNYSILQLWQ